MSAPAKLNPVRVFVGRAVYWLIWGPMIVIALPFVLVDVFVDWLHWKAFRFVADTTQPTFGAVEGFARYVGNRIMGWKPDQ